MQVVVAGGGPAGLLAASLLAQRGVSVVLVDPSINRWPSTASALHGWVRPKVPQLWHGHAFHALGRQVLTRSAPQVLDWLLDNGATALCFADFIPASQRNAQDEDMVSILCRRPLLDIALLRSVSEGSLARFVTDAAVTGLRTHRAGSIAAVLLSSGESIACDVLIDAMGRRSPVRSWLPCERSVDPSHSSDDTERVYLCQHFRFVGSARPAIGANPFGPSGETDGVRVSVLREDNDFFALTLNLPRSSGRSSALRIDLAAWRAVVSHLPDVAAWIDERRAVPEGSARLVCGPPNRIVDVSQWPNGLIAIGDAFATTNPTHGWGLSLALAHAEIVAEALTGSGGLSELSDRTRLRLVARTRPAVDVARRDARERSDPTLRRRAELDHTSPTFFREHVYPRAMNDPQALRSMVRRTQFLEFDDASR